MEVCRCDEELEYSLNTGEPSEGFQHSDVICCSSFQCLYCLSCGVWGTG